MRFENSVFINCPLDDSYINSLLKPMLYVILRNGLNPRLSVEVSDSGQIRLEKITEIIKSCRYSIHDLSIVKSKKANEFARMNMPFELGIDYGLRQSGLVQLQDKQFLLIEATGYDYMKAVSDLNGFDIKVHGNETERLFDCLYAWFSETMKLHKQDPPRKLFYDFFDFNTSLFREKVKMFRLRGATRQRSEELAKNYIQKVSIPEYMQEIRERL